MPEYCEICGCPLHRKRGTYAQPTVEGRGHATKHHFVAERFFGRTPNRRGTQREGVFSSSCPWDHEGESALFCYECHEELLHNPVLLPEDISHFHELVRRRGFTEEAKSESRAPIAGRIKLLQEVISLGIAAALEQKVQSDG